LKLARARAAGKEKGSTSPQAGLQFRQRCRGIWFSVMLGQTFFNQCLIRRG
jgi:hypothetical protein